MAVTYTVKGDSFVPEKPRVWSNKRLVDSAGRKRVYGLTPDGKRIAALMQAEEPETENNDRLF